MPECRQLCVNIAPFYLPNVHYVIMQSLYCITFVLCNLYAIFLFGIKRGFASLLS